MKLPESVHAALSGDGAIGQVRPLSGGAVSTAAFVERRNGAPPLFVKWNTNTPPLPDFFAAEADGLQRLRAANTLRVPDVVQVGDRNTPPFLALEWLAPQPPKDLARFTQRFAEKLAVQHQITANQFGLERDNYLGSQPQSNTWQTHWPVFYREQRLLPQMRRAASLGLLPLRREQALRAVVSRLEDLLNDLPDIPSLLHGDLWSGNFLCAENDTPALIDPALYFGPREMEIAYIELFGGFPDGFVAAYDRVFPLDGGYPRRRSLHQLYPLLIHLNHFGETYGPAVDRVCRLYGSA